MNTVRSFERTVHRVEGFKIKIRHARDGRDVRGDFETTATYPYQRRARSEWSVSEFLTKRLQKHLPGFTVEVIDPSGNHVNGRTRLRNLRAAYEN